MLPITICVICGRNYDCGGMFSSGPLDWETIISFEDKELAKDILTRLRAGENVIVSSCFFQKKNTKNIKFLKQHSFLRGNI